tara:strand:- start:291 stop:515 length:225 start_codon:yes stop_codon:yes gene_type:complete
MNILKDLRKFVHDIEHLAEFHEEEFALFTAKLTKFLVYIDHLKGREIAHIMMDMEKEDQEGNKPEIIHDQGAEA